MTTTNMTLSDNTARPLDTSSSPLVPPAPVRSVVPAAGSLADIARQVRALDKEAHVGPLKSALRLVQLDESWEKYRAEAGDLSFEAWCEKAFGNPKHADIVRRRAAAVEKCKSLGYPHTYATGTFNHAVLVYLMGRSIPEKRRAEMVKLAASEQKARHNVLPYQIVRNLVIAALGKVAQRNKRAALLELAMQHIKACHEADASNSLPSLPKALSGLLP